MKKIIALVLAVACVLALASCDVLDGILGNDGGVDVNAGTGKVSDIQKLVDESAPVGADISVTLDSTLGVLNGEYDVVYNEDGSAKVTYTYELFNEFNAESPATELKTAYSGEVNVSATGELDAELNGVASVEAISFELNLDESKLTDASVEAGVLTATVSAENTESVLGVNVGYDVSISVSTGADRVTSVAITYVSNAGNVEITTVYSY